MNQTLFFLTIVFLLTACNQNRSTKANQTIDTINVDSSAIETEINDQYQETKRLSFKSISEIVADSSFSCWVQLQDSSASLSLHFQYKDTLAVSYSSECWLRYPYKLDGNKIVVYWDNIIDTKYDFDIVKAITKTDKKYIGQPFMILYLENDTTLRATYPINGLIKKINNSSEERGRIFFPDNYTIAQDGYL